LVTDAGNILFLVLAVATVLFIYTRLRLRRKPPTDDRGGPPAGGVDKDG